MNILFIGDIVAKPGVAAVTEILPKIREVASIDFVLANIENSAGGRGTNSTILKELLASGVDFFTSGNHIWHGQHHLLDDPTLPIIRPANYSHPVPGRGFSVLETPNGLKILIINLLGRTLINQPVDCPYKAIETILQEEQSSDVAITLVDFHAEVTSEKVALGWYVDGRVSAVFGTHTHVPTADCWIMPQGTGYVTDVGMVGTQHSVLGVDPYCTLKALTLPFPTKFTWVEEGSPVVFNSVLLKIDDKNGKTVAIERVDRVIK